MARYLVTGGGGFIGSNIATQLLDRGEQVRVLDNFSTGRRSNLAPHLERIETVEGDIRSYHIVREAMENADVVLHQAALPSVPRSVRDPITTTEVNILGTLNVLQAAKEAGVKRLVYASSSSVYGNSAELPKRETMCPHPMSPYAISKLAGELNCQVFWQIYGFETVCLRYFNVFGPRQDPTSQYAAVVPIFATALLEGRPLTINGDGSHSRDFTFVENVVQANLLACTAPGAAGEVFNIACGERTTLLDLVSILAELTGRDPDLRFAPTRQGDVPHSQADVAKAGEMLGYHPAISLKAGLERVVAWYRPAQ